MISAAYKIGTEKPKDIQVFNFASGLVNPQRWGPFFDDVKNAAPKYPLDRGIWYPSMKVTINPILKVLHPALFMYFPALILDVGRRLQGKKPV